MNTKILYFDDNSNAYAYPAAKLVNMRESAATTVDIYFAGSVGDTQGVTSNDKISLTITSGKAKEVMQAIVEKINEVDGPRTDDFIVIADNANQVYLTADITDVADAIGT